MSTTIDPLLQIAPTASQPASSREGAESVSFAAHLLRAREAQPAADKAAVKERARDTAPPEEGEPAEQAAGGSTGHNTHRDEEAAPADAPAAEDTEPADSEPTDSFEYTSEGAEAAALVTEPVIATAQSSVEQTTEFVGVAVDTPAPTDTPASLDAPGSAAAEETARQTSEIPPPPTGADDAPPPTDADALLSEGEEAAAAPPEDRPGASGKELLEELPPEQASAEPVAEQETEAGPAAGTASVEEPTTGGGATTQTGPSKASAAAATGDIDNRADGVPTNREKEEPDTKTTADARTAAVVDAEAAVAKPDSAEEETDLPERKEAKAEPARTDEATRSRGFDRLMANRNPSTGPSTESDPTATVDRARFVSRVANAFRVAQQRDGQIQLRLSPPELGSVKITLTVQDGALAAKLETETASARSVLLDNLPALRERLAEQQIRVEKFDVDVRQEGGQSGNASTGDAPKGGQQNGVGSDRSTRPATTATEEYAPRSRPGSTDQRRHARRADLTGKAPYVNHSPASPRRPVPARPPATSTR